MTRSDRGRLAVTVRDAVTAVPGVTRLVPGAPVEIATQYPGGKVPGIRLAGPVVEVHVSVDRLPVQVVAGEVRDVVRAVLAAAGDERQVQVVVEDLDLAGPEGLPDTPDQGLAEPGGGS
ncbi:MAG: hypothetical protein HKP61_08300 [Dactylosporangium sp.]|nr:hypothetical protein [Dactylosporangium sp.]NNJ60938.1 hypothetical protein [Dactylosporangium sp.]